MQTTLGLDKELPTLSTFPCHSSYFPHYPSFKPREYNDIVQDDVELNFDLELMSTPWLLMPILMDQITPSFSVDAWDWESKIIDVQTAQPVEKQEPALLRINTKLETQNFNAIEAVLTKDKRGYIVLNLYETERNYVKDLELIIKEYKLPIQQNKILKETSTKLLFSKIEELLRLHTIFYTMLEETISVKNWSTETSCIGKATEFTALYQKFIETYAISRKQLNSEMKSNPDFNAFLEKKFKLLKRELSEFLVLPAQRTTRYHLLLKDLVKQTDESHPDFVDLIVAWEAMTKLAEKINTAKRNADESMGLFEAYEQTKNCPPTLINASRRMVLQCDVVESSIIQLPTEVSIFKKKEDTKRFKFWRIHDLLDISCEDVGEASVRLIICGNFSDIEPSPQIDESLSVTNEEASSSSPPNKIFKDIGSTASLNISPRKDTLSSFKKEREHSSNLIKDFGSFLHLKKDFGSNAHLMGKNKDTSLAKNKEFGSLYSIGKNKDLGSLNLTGNKKELGPMNLMGKKKESVGRPSSTMDSEAGISVKAHVSMVYIFKFDGYDAKKTKLMFIQAFENEIKKCRQLLSKELPLKTLIVS